MLSNLKAHWYLLTRFRNGWHMVGCYRRGEPCAEAVLWEGRRLRHPRGRGGFVGTILEVWREEPYSARGFYRPCDGDVVLDVGAHVGLFSLWLVRQNPRCRVVAIEPSTENFACLQANVAAMGARQVSTYRYALGPRGGTGRVEPTTDRSIDHRLVPAPASNADAVPILSLQDLLDVAGADNVAMLKMDIEGAEYDVFAEVAQSTLRRVERLAVEYHDHLRPGTLNLIQQRLEPTHDVTIRPKKDEDYGVLLATRRS